MKTGFMIKKKKGARIGIFLLIAAAGVVLLGLAVMLLWNAVLPSLLKLPAIAFWQAVSLLILARILFGNHGPRRGPGLWAFKAWGAREKWASMSPAQQEHFREHWGRHCRPHTQATPWKETEQSDETIKE